MTSGRFGELLLIKGTRHITVPRGEHFIIGIAEKAIQDIDNAVATTMADAGIPKKYWDIDSWRNLDLCMWHSSCR